MTTEMYNNVATFIEIFIHESLNCDIRSKHFRIVYSWYFNNEYNFIKLLTL